MSNRRPTDVDAQLGTRLRELRQKHSLSQAEVGDLIGVSYQQIQKFEVGTNRMSASQLLGLANGLDVPIEHFFRGLRTHRALKRPVLQPDPDAVAAVEFASTKRGFKLLRAIALLESESLRNCVIEFVEKLANATKPH
jgi:transcriptional regulator with XRE-family HTH domain